MKNTNGFTLIELLVVIAIIGVLALMGLRLYLTQQDKAKNAIVKANAGTIQTLIQANMADTDYTQEAATDRVNQALNDIANAGTIQTLIQANMADTNYEQDTADERITAALGDITDAAGCHNPYTGGTGNINVIKDSGDTLIDGNDIDYGKIAIASPNINEFNIQGLDQDGKLFGEVLQAKE